MLQKFLLIITLICMTKCEHSFQSYSTENLYAILDQTTEYFKNLSNAYEVLNTDSSNDINNAINKYMENVTKTIFQSNKRQKRSLPNDLQSNKEEQFHREAGEPGILEASVEPIDNSIWIILRLPQQTLILRYQVWKELERYILPGSSSFVISKTPNNQHLLIRFDGIWNLEGISQPEHIFKMPLDGKIKTFALGADYYVKATTANNTTVLKARFVGN